MKPDYNPEDTAGNRYGKLIVQSMRVYCRMVIKERNDHYIDVYAIAVENDL